MKILAIHLVLPDDHPLHACDELFVTPDGRWSGKRPDPDGYWPIVAATRPPGAGQLLLGDVEEA